MFKLQLTVMSTTLALCVLYSCTDNTSGAMTLDEQSRGGLCEGS